MKKINLFKCLLILGIALALNACKKDNSTKTSATGTDVGFAIAADNAFGSLNSVNGGTPITNATASVSVNWTSAVANIAFFKFEAKTRNTEIEIKTRSLTNVNLFAPTPATISAAIDTGTYREIEIKVELLKTSSGTIPLILKGSFTSSSGAVTPIEFDFNDDAEIKAEAQNVTVDGKTDIATIIKFHLNKLLAGIPSSTLDRVSPTGGTIIISSNSNTNIYNHIKDNFSSSGEGGGFEHKGKDGRGHDGGDDH